MKATFPVLSSVADEGALAAWAQASYGLPSPVSCRFERRSMSDAYRLESGADTYYLKVYSPGRHEAAAIDAEMRFLLDLRARDISVVEPVATAEGEYATPLPMPEGARQAALFRGITGEGPREEEPAHAAQYGALLAQVHTAGDELGARYARWSLDEHRLIHEPVELRAPYVSHRPHDEAFLRDLGAELADELLSRVPKSLPAYGICHGDARATQHSTRAGASLCSTSTASATDGARWTSARSP